MLEPTMQRRPVDSYGPPASQRPHSNLYQGQHPQSQQHMAHPGHPFPHSRRTPSVNTFSTTSSMAPPAAYRQSSASDLRRSESNRSAGTTNGSASSYVALLRKQKATVWCDRAQYEDPRLAAQQRAAKQRANLEVVGGRRQGGHSGSRSNTGISTTNKVAAKIRHHGKQPVVSLTPGENHVGVGGVPLRLSATEVEGESSDDDKMPASSKLHHRRTGSSGRSSNASGRRGLAYRTSGGQGSINSRNSQNWTPGDTPERSGSLVDLPSQQQQQQLQYGEAGGADDHASTKAKSTNSAETEAEKADNVAELGNAPRLASNSLLHSALTREKSVKNPEELKRRGSVDERTATLTSQRLYIANPD
ncbi:uncharacterized protein F5Z01DRAFT_683631 [Emericellopsis atlantica]|uniref:Uncharacterized protein n=1 Tax=Emericellopsis atlantica TaxID=2614577 RepID=A0A9P7ZFX4_9HYPO|nr:uncharacterized protein F5Z01DRAFT_683631 [Emericellopsis atlantica]KAG9250937.1 hypothetical protein F5Z01DRAFT_683631 [Emericellopsis atlantica]